MDINRYPAFDDFFEHFQYAHFLKILNSGNLAYREIAKIVMMYVTVKPRKQKHTFLKHKILLDDYKVHPELNKHKNI